MGSIVLDVLTIVLCLSGLVFFIGGTVGLLRFPDLYSRLHPATKGDTLGAMLIVLALCFQAGISLVTLKLIVIVGFLLLSSSTCAHAISRSAFTCRVVPWHREEVDPWPQEVSDK